MSGTVNTKSHSRWLEIVTASGWFAAVNEEQEIGDNESL
jgi:hypothetical protein